jgi:hypothetical protein
MFRFLEMHLLLTYESISPCSPMEIFIRNATKVRRLLVVYVPGTWYPGTVGECLLERVEVVVTRLKGVKRVDDRRSRLDH